MGTLAHIRERKWINLKVNISDWNEASGRLIETKADIAHANKSIGLCRKSHFPH